MQLVVVAVGIILIIIIIVVTIIIPISTANPNAVHCCVVSCRKDLNLFLLCGPMQALINCCQALYYMLNIFVYKPHILYLYWD